MEYNCEVWMKTRPLTCQERLPSGRFCFTMDEAIELAKKKHGFYPNINFVVRQETVACAENNWQQSFAIVFDTEKAEE